MSHDLFDTLVFIIHIIMVLQLRSGAKINSEEISENNNNQGKKSEDQNGMTLVVFFGLLLDLLAFTLILPLFPALLDHYRKHDDQNGLYHFLDSKVRSLSCDISDLFAYKHEL